jgi:hypothetical protein
VNAPFILLIILTAARLWIGLQLFLTARKSKLINLYWLAGLFFLAIYSVFTPLSGSPLGNYWIFHLGFIAGHFCLAMFIHATFYRGRKSPVAIVLGLIVLAFFADIYALSINNLDLAGIMLAVGLVNWIWHFFVAQSAYSAIAADPTVENWIKARYRLMLVYIVLIAFATVHTVAANIANLASFIPSFVVLISLLLILGSIILQFLVWVMPERFRLWLNRQQQARPTEDEQRPLSILDVFGAAMTNNTGLQRMICLYAIRATVAKRILSEDSATVQKYLDGMTYYEWEATLQHSELRRLLINGGADQASATKAIENACLALIEKQSLFTLGAR